MCNIDFLHGVEILEKVEIRENFYLVKLNIIVNFGQHTSSQMNG